MDSKSIVSIASVASNLIEQNISQIEKIHTRIKISRFIGGNIFFFLAVCFIIGFCYVVNSFFNSYYFVCFLVLFLFFLLTLKLSKRAGKPLSLSISAYVLFVVLDTGIIYLLHGYLVELFDGSSDKIDATTALAPLTILCFLSTFLLYFLSKTLAEVIIQRLFNDTYSVEVHLTNGLMLRGRLINITRKNDYIIKTEMDEEMLVRYNSIVFVKLKNSKIIQ
ncbi:hypothetical protein [Paenibacillus dendritiformis]|uniref:hypothetical protein n=1 Tax=Paenibacillus dendritiformis TaxID=130049 RepID=UPI00387E13E2